MERIARAEAFFAATKADIRNGGAGAFFSQADDRIQMPSFEAFREPEGYYATLAHEMIHWTKATPRLNRDFGRKRFGDSGYAMEAACAEPVTEHLVLSSKTKTPEQFCCSRPLVEIGQRTPSNQN